MTTIALPRPADPATRPRLVSRPLLLVLLADLGGLTSFYLLLAPVPQHAGGGAVAGLATAVLMLTSVAGELGVPGAVARFGSRTVLMAGLALLGLPALALLVSASLPVVLAVCAARGLGLAVIFVVCGALGAELVPAERRGEGLGVLGVVAGVPAVVATPMGVWLMSHAGPAVVFLVGGVAALAGLAAVAGLPAGRSPGVGSAETDGMRAGLRNPALMRPAVVFAGTTTAAGIAVTFLPAMTGATGGLVAVALLVQAAAATVTRWWAGRFGDRHGAHRLLVPGVVVAATGFATLVLAHEPAVLLTGMLLFGAGFGAVQSASQAMMFARVAPAGYGTSSAVWSIAYDTGYGLGALAFGVVANLTGQPVGIALTAVTMLATLVLLRHRRR
jgi:predicted MFS family arabinose efflux permease